MGEGGDSGDLRRLRVGFGIGMEIGYRIEIGQDRIDGRLRTW
jgi:hypothetical protein